MSPIEQKLFEAVPEKNRVDHGLRISAANRANGNPLPGALSDAFVKTSIRVGPLLVRKVVASDWIILRAINSPIIKLVEELSQRAGNENIPPPDVEVSDQEELDIAFQFTRDLDEVRSALDDGVESFKKCAVREIGDVYERATVNLVGLAVMEQIRRTWATPLKYKQDMEKDGEVTFFQDASQGTKMALAGGSNTSADSGEPSVQDPPG